MRLVEVLAAEERKDLPVAEQILKETLADEIHLRQFTPAFTAYLTSSLAEVVAAQGRLDDARALIRPFCAVASQGEASGVADSVRRGLCPGE